MKILVKFNGKPLQTFIPSEKHGSPESASKLARAARKRGIKPHVPEEGEPWEQEREDTNTGAARRADLMETARMLLGVYCRSNSIDDAECQRIADRINYEHSEKNHLRNAKPLKGAKEITEKKIYRMIEKMKTSKAQKKIEKTMEEILGRKRLPEMKI